MIDFVITWVDGGESEWKKSFSLYSKQEFGDKRSVRFRDWDNLKYWFRSIETYAPWVNKIHFVTQGHVPSWLNTQSKKINIVKHADIIDEKYLPLFNSRAIEVNLHKICGLSEQFVYFNDDMFITDHVLPEFFFKNGLPCDSLIYNVISPTNELAIPLIRNMKIINKTFAKVGFFNRKLFNYKYGIDNIRNIILQLWPSILGYYEPHQPNSYLKKTFELLWKKEEEILLQTTRSKFKNDSNVNQFLFRYWQLSSEQFSPRNHNQMKMVSVKNKKDIDIACRLISTNKYKIICINDNDEIYDFNDAALRIRKTFLNLLSHKSSYEL